MEATAPLRSRAPSSEDIAARHAAVVLRLRGEQRFFAAIIAGLVAAAVGAAAWGGLAALLHVEWRLLGIGLGAAVGLAVQVAGRGVDARFGLVSGLLAIFSWAAGHVLGVALLLARQEHVSLLRLLALVSPAEIGLALWRSMSPFDAGTVAAVAIAAWVVAFRRLDEDERFAMGRARGA